MAEPVMLVTGVSNEIDERIALRRLPRTVALLGLMVSALAGPVGAQNGVLVGAVFRDSAGHELRGAEVSIAQLQRRLVVNYLGAYRLDGLKPGTYVVMARAVGFAPVRDTVEIVAGKETMHDFVLAPQVTSLDSVRVTAPEVKYISPGLRGFEERRRLGMGHFVGEDQLRREDGRPLANVVLPRIPGLVAIPEGSSVFLASSRNNSSGGPALIRPTRPPVLNAIKVKGCWVTVYIDNVRIYDASMTARDPSIRPPDMGRIGVTEYAGIEFYAGGATVPPQYNVTGSDCGTLLLWTRER